MFTLVSEVSEGTQRQLTNPDSATTTDDKTSWTFTVDFPPPLAEEAAVYGTEENDMVVIVSPTLLPTICY